MNATRRITALGMLALAGLATFTGPATSTPRSKTPLRVGMVVLPGNPGVLTTYPIGGLRRAVRELGIRGTVLTPTVKEGYAPGFTTLGRQGYDLVFGIGLQQAYDAVRVAPRFPRTRFVLVDVSTAQLDTRPPNILGLVFQEQQVGYLVAISRP